MVLSPSQPPSMCSAAQDGWALSHTPFWPVLLLPTVDPHKNRRAPNRPVHRHRAAYVQARAVSKRCFQTGDHWRSMRRQLMKFSWFIANIPFQLIFQNASVFKYKHQPAAGINRSLLTPETSSPKPLNQRSSTALSTTVAVISNCAPTSRTF